MEKLKPTHQAGHQSIHRSSVTINVKYGTFSLSKKARDTMKLKNESTFDIIKYKNVYYFQPNEKGEFIFIEKKNKPNRLYFTDKNVSEKIKKDYGISSESFMLALSEKPINIDKETNCFILHK